MKKNFMKIIIKDKIIGVNGKGNFPHDYGIIKGFEGKSHRGEIIRPGKYRIYPVTIQHDHDDTWRILWDDFT